MTVMDALAGTLFLLVFVYTGHAHQFTVQPESMVQAEGLEAVFECLVPGAVSHTWGFNGVFLAADQFSSNVTRIAAFEGSLARLIIPATPQYNNTVVQCRAIVDEGGGSFRSVLSNNATLRVQGPLPDVSDLHFLFELSSDTTITISWDPPFSLNLTTAEPDIQYCVDVYNVTGGGDDHLQSVCDITDTYYTFTASDPDQLFIFTVTPRSNVEGSLNGTTSQPVQGYLLLEPVVVDTGDFKQYVNLRVSSEEATLQVIIPEDVLGSPRHTPTNYTFEFDCFQTQPLNYSAAPRILVNNSLTVEFEVKRHQICDVTLFAINGAGQTKYDSILEISTHDVQLEQAVYSTDQKQVDVSCSYLEASQDRGYLVIVFSEHNIFPAVYGAAHRTGLESTTNVSIPGEGLENPMVVVYDLNNPSGLPERISAVKPRPAHAMTTTSGGSAIHNEGSLLEKTLVTSENGKICLNCSFSADVLTGCVGVIHSVQLDNLTLTVLSVEWSGGVNCTVDELMEGNYSVAVFGQKGTILEQNPANVTTVFTVSTMSGQTTVPPLLVQTDGSVTTAITGVVCGVAVFVVILLLLLVLLILMRKNQKLTRVRVVAPRSTETKEESPPRYETLPVNKPDPGYENVTPTDQRFTPPVQESIEMEDIVSTSQVRMVPGHTEEHSQIESPDSPLVVVDLPQESAYEETKEALEMQTLTNEPSSDSTQAEHQYSEISGAVSQESGLGVSIMVVCERGTLPEVHYAQLDNKRDPGGGQSSEDPTRVQYASIDERRLVPVSDDIHVLVEDVPAPPPQPPPPPTSETVLPELNSIADKWEKLGEALGVSEHTLDNISVEGSDQVRLHEMVHYYFSSTQFTHSWEEIVRALWEIEETETADRIVRTRNLDMSLPSNDCPPPLPPRNRPVIQSDFGNHEPFSDQSFTAPGQESSEIEDIASTSQGHNHPQTESPESPLMVVDLPQEPVYEETKEALEMQTLTNDPSSDSTQAEHKYSEISGTVSQESGVHCAELDNKRDLGRGQSSEDPTEEQYISIDEQQLVPVSEDIHVLVEDVPADVQFGNPISDFGPKEGECVPGQNHSLPNDSLHEKEEHGRKFTAEKCSLKQLLNRSVQLFVGKSSPKMAVRLDAETSKLESSSSDIKDNAQMKIFPSYECSSTSAYSQQDVPPKPKAHTLTCRPSELIYTKEVVQVRKQGQESKEDRNETDEPSDNSLDKIHSPETSDVEHLNNSTCDKPSITNDLNNFNCVCAETSFQAGKSEPVLNEMPITNAQVPSSTCCTGTLAIDVSSRAVVTGVRSNYQSPGGYKLPTQTTDSPSEFQYCGQEHNRNLMVGRDFQAEMTKKVTTKHYQGFIGKSTSIWSQLIATVSNKVLSFDEFQTSTKARTPRTKSRSDSVVNPISSEEKVDERGPFPKHLKPVTYSPSSHSNSVDKEASSKSFREANRKAQGGKEQHRMWPWKFHTLPSPPQDWNDINTEGGLQLPKHGVLFQLWTLGHRLLAWTRAEDC